MVTNYSVMKTLRLTPEEAEQLKEKAREAGMKEAEYLRFLLGHKPNDYPEIRQLLNSLINEVNHIGINVNQIVKRYNSGLYNQSDKQLLTAYMKKLNVAVEQVVKTLGNQ